MKISVGIFIPALIILIFAVSTGASAQQVESGANSIAGSRPSISNKPGNADSGKPQAGITTAIAYDGRLLGDEQSVRLLIELDSKVELQSFYMDNPPRLVIDMSKTVFRFQEPELIKPRGLVEEFRFGTMARGRSRIVLSLSAPVKIAGQVLQATAGGRYRFALDLEKIGRQEFIRQIANQRATLGKSGNIATKGDRISRARKTPGRRIIVLDPGHGGIDGGANGANNSVEKDITLAIALLLEKALKSAGPYDVYLTRREDYFLGLKGRVEFTARKRADLFISIHTDTLDQKQVRGAAIYTLSRKASDDISRKLAETKNRSDLAAGLANEEVEDEVIDILDDLAARETKKFSVRFARRIVSIFRDDIVMIKNPHRFAAFGVLKDPNVPSVLLELGYLSNLEDEKLLQSGVWRAKLVDSLAQAVGRFFSNRVR